MNIQSLDPDEKRRSRLLNILILGIAAGTFLAILMTVLSTILYGGDTQAQITVTYLLALITSVGTAVTIVVNRYGPNLAISTLF